MGSKMMQVKEPGSKTSRLRIHQPAMRAEMIFSSGSNLWHLGRKWGHKRKKYPLMRSIYGVTNDSEY